MERQMGKYNKDRDTDYIPENAPIWAHRIGKLLCEKNNMTQGELAKEIGVTPSTITGWMKGDKKGNFTEPKIEGLIAVAKHFDVSVDYLVGFSDSRKTKLSYKMVSKYFGLTDKSIERLQKLKKNKMMLKMVNFILENDDFWDDFELEYIKYFDLSSEVERYTLNPEQKEYLDKLNYSKFSLFTIFSKLLEESYQALKFRKYKLFDLDSIEEKKRNKRNR